jgi:hypothetical protein
MNMMQVIGRLRHVVFHDNGDEEMFDGVDEEEDRDDEWQ